MIARTRIVYNEKELLQLIYQHLSEKGLKKAAMILQQEADLPSVPASRVSSTPTQLQNFVCFDKMME